MAKAASPGGEVPDPCCSQEQDWLGLCVCACVRVVVLHTHACTHKSICRMNSYIEVADLRQTCGNVTAAADWDTDTHWQRCNDITVSHPTVVSFFKTKSNRLRKKCSRRSLNKSAIGSSSSVSAYCFPFLLLSFLGTGIPKCFYTANLKLTGAPENSQTSLLAKDDGSLLSVEPTCLCSALLLQCKNDSFCSEDPSSETIIRPRRHRDHKIDDAVASWSVNIHHPSCIRKCFSYLGTLVIFCCCCCH